MTDRLSTARLALRPPGRADIPRLLALANNWAVASAVSRMPYPYGPGDAEAFLGLLARSTDDTVLALVRSEGLIGCMGLHRRDGDAHELGYWLGEPYWGQGNATEAGRAMLAYGFGMRGAAVIEAGHFIDNPASGRVLEKLGFRYSGRAERECLARGCRVESLEMILERTNWVAA